MPTAAVYARQSFYKEDSCSIDMQVERAKAFCISQGWEYVIYDIDKGYSGKDTDRPGFRQMMKDIQAGNIQFVVAYKLDRISRNLRDFFDLMEEFKAKEVGFRSLTENFDTTTPMGRAMLAIIAVFAQLERETTAERVRDNMLDRARMGIWNGGPIPYGFISEKSTMQVNGKEKEFSFLVPEETESNWVQAFFNWYLEPNGSIRNNVMKANHLEIPTKTGKAWNANQMQRILSNPLYCQATNEAREYYVGLGVQIASEESDFDGIHGLMWYNRRKPHGKTTRLRDQSDWVLSVGGHQGTISGDTFVAVQEKMASVSKASPRGGTGKKGLFAYLIKCAKCNKSMVYVDYGKWQYYRCRANTLQGPAVCPGQTVKGAEIEEAVISTIKSMCTDKAFLEGIARQAMQSANDAAQPLLEEKNRLTAKMDELTGEQKELIRALGKKTMPEELIEERIREIEKEKHSLNQYLSELDGKIENQDWQKIDMEYVFGNLLKFNEVFDQLEFEEKRNFLRSIVKEIIYDEGKIRIAIYFMPEIMPADTQPGDTSFSGTSVMSEHGFILPISIKFAG